MRNSRVLWSILKNIRFSKTELNMDFVPRRRGLGYVENYIVSEQDAVQQLFSKRPKKTFVSVLETPEETKLTAVSRRRGQVS